MAAGSILKTILDSVGATFNGKMWSSDGTSAGDTLPGFVQYDPTTMAPVNQQGTVNTAPDTSAVMNGATALTPKFAKIACSSSGVNIVVAAVASKKIRVLGYVLTGSAAVNAKFQSHTTPTDLSGLIYIGVAGGGASASFNPNGWFESLSGESLDLNLSAAVAVGGHLIYIEV